jgi:hypothetical protein
VYIAFKGAALLAGLCLPVLSLLAGGTTTHQ